VEYLVLKGRSLNTRGTFVIDVSKRLDLRSAAMDIDEIPIRLSDFQAGSKPGHLGNDEFPSALSGNNSFV
jgi:hypothetical protein